MGFQACSSGLHSHSSVSSYQQKEQLIIEVAKMSIRVDGSVLLCLWKGFRHDITFCMDSYKFLLPAKVMVAYSIVTMLALIMV